MYLIELIEFLEKQDQDIIVPMGFNNPHSYRGDYSCLAFEPKKNVTIGDMLKDARKSIGSIHRGWKGGDYIMSEYTDVYLAETGKTGDAIGCVLLSYMLGEYKVKD